MSSKIHEKINITLMWRDMHQVCIFLFCQMLEGTVNYKILTLLGFITFYCVRKGDYSETASKFQICKLKLNVSLKKSNLEKSSNSGSSE